MRASIEYKDISNLTLNECIESFMQAEKIVMGDATLDDFAITESIGSTKLHEFTYRQCFGFGVYILFEKGNPIYVGMTGDNFFTRLLSHCNTEEKPFWGWNALLKKIAFRQNIEKKQDNISNSQLTEALEILKEFELIRINVLSEDWDKATCKKLEKLFMRGYKLKGYNILNTRTGSIQKNDLSKPIHTLI